MHAKQHHNPSHDISKGSSQTQQQAATHWGRHEDTPAYAFEKGAGAAAMKTGALGLNMKRVMDGAVATADATVVDVARTSAPATTRRISLRLEYALYAC